MDRGQLRELCFIAPIGSVPSILDHGILSHEAAKHIPHVSIANPLVQDRRANKRFAGGLDLHEYANLYICARNPMLFDKKGLHRTTAVLRVHPDVIDVPGVIVSDSNAASDYARFAAGAAGLAIVDYEHTFAERWWWPGIMNVDYWQRKSAKCAEVLVPHSVPPPYILGAYVSGPTGQAALEATGCDLPVVADPVLFFLEDPH